MYFQGYESAFVASKALKKCSRRRRGLDIFVSAAIIEAQANGWQAGVHQRIFAMGPRQLQTFLSKTVAPQIIDVDDEVRSHGQVGLVVDFPAFTFWLLGYHNNEIVASDLGRVTALARRLVEGLASRGVRFHFVEDGAQGCNGPEEMESKLTELKSRFAQRQADRAKLKHFLEGTDCDPGQIHGGPLFADAVRAGIREAGASVQLAHGEADPECARAVEQTKALAVLGNDTDFVIMQGGAKLALISNFLASRLVTFQNFDPHFAVLPALLDLRNIKEPEPFRSARDSLQLRFQSTTGPGAQHRGVLRVSNSHCSSASKDLQGERQHEKKFVLKALPAGNSSPQ
ncbi:spn-E [Symbiodinium sp. CCMP2592]|nr:spn-E [Symbiodinium sp. CCMP2592]